MADVAPRTILHVDMDAFFVSCEYQRDPALRGRPVVVGGSGQRGVVAAASYEARAYGVFSAMPSVRAKRLCPQAVFLPGDYARYAEVSERVMAIFRSFTPLVEPLSLDEAFLDVSGGRRLWGDGLTIAHQIRDQVFESEGCTCSVGVAPLKFLAKLASEAAKPKASPTGPVLGSGVVVIEPGSELEFLHPLPVRALWGVGAATMPRLQRLGISTIGDLAVAGEAVLVRNLGEAAGRHLHRLANAIDERDVEPAVDPKSISNEETFGRDLHTHEALGRELVRLADSVGSRARHAGLSGRTVTIKVRFSADFKTVTRSATLDTPTATGTEIARAAKTLLAGLDPSPGVRLIGVALTGLGSESNRQLSLGEEDDRTAWDEVAKAVEDVRTRFGRDAVVPATLAGPGGIRTKRKGDQQWGPDA